MAVLGTTLPTLLDVAKSSGPDGKIAKTTEVLSQINAILDDMTWQEGNLPNGHLIQLASALPTPTWRILNKGVQPTKGVDRQVTEKTAMLEAYAEIDKKLAQLNGNTAAWRALQDRKHLQGMQQSLAQVLFYGDDTVAAEKFAGLAVRYYSSSTTNNPAGAYVLKAGGVGADNTSVWLVGWGEAVYGIYPKGTVGGIQVEDLGQVTLLDSNSGRFEGYRTHYQQDCGVAIEDYRQIVRIANIDVSDLAAGTVDVLKLMVQATQTVNSLEQGRFVWYMNRATATAVVNALLAKSNVYLSISDYTGANGIVRRSTMQFLGYPIRIVDQIVNTESLVA